jgi:cytochrome c-type biogenesis protein CcmH
MYHEIVQNKKVKMKRPLFILLYSLILALLAVSIASAQDPTPRPVSDDEVNAIAKQLYCPVCENVPLDVCPTQACEQWRATIREKLTLGWSEQQIKDYFVAQYGDRVLATPPARGFNWLVYLLPPLALAAAGVVLWQTMRRWQRAGDQAQPPDAPSETDPYVQRLEEELKRRG